jgi:peptidoglycan/LPS O-acetylase OafA/YrhL
MPEPTMSSDLDGVPAQVRAVTWQSTVAGVGLFLLCVSLFVAVDAQGALGPFPLAVALLAGGLLAVAAIAGILHRARASKGSGKQRV